MAWSIRATAFREIPSNHDLNWASLAIGSGDSDSMVESANKRFWWVNQNQTFAQELRGGYLWSPKRKSNDQRNPFYEFMREVAPGDAVFSFADTRIQAIGIAQSFCYECPKPPEFGVAGPNWSLIGWKVDVQFTKLRRPVRPSDHMRVLGPLLPEKYAPLRANGSGCRVRFQEGRWI